ncbi:MAG: hypothetical protein ACJ748_01410, partial [Flavisolibacter sp.]
MKKSTCKIFSAILIFLALVQYAAAQNSDSFTNQIMSGVSNKGQNKNKPYLTAGDRTYIVGTEDGNFPDLGSHVPGEMGGLWMQPIKLMDGFWVKLSETGTKSEAWLENAHEFINYPYGNRFFYAPVLDGIEAERFQFCPQGKEGMAVQYQLKNKTSRLRKLQLEFVVKTDLSPVWFSKENNIIDAADTIYWMEDKKLLVAKDIKNPWYTVLASSLSEPHYNKNAIAPIETIGKGRTASVSCRVVMKPFQTLSVVFVISGSNKDLLTALSNNKSILKNYRQLLNKKKEYYAAIIHRARINISDKSLQQAYTWGKLNTEWLVSELPGLGRFLGAGAIEYPWLFGCDNSYASQGVVASGDPELAKSTLRLIKKVSEKVNGNGRI